MSKAIIALLIINFALLVLCGLLAWALLITYDRYDKWRTPLGPIEFDIPEDVLEDGEEAWPGYEND